MKVVPAVADDRSLAEIERKRGRDFAAGLSMRVLSRTWQMLFKGLAEVKEAARQDLVALADEPPLHARSPEPPIIAAPPASPAARRN